MKDIVFSSLFLNCAGDRCGLDLPSLLSSVSRASLVTSIQWLIGNSWTSRAWTGMEQGSENRLGRDVVTGDSNAS